MKKIHFAWWVLVACCALQFGVTGIAASTAGVFFSPVSTELGVGVGTFSLYSTIQSITMMLSYPLAGKFLSKYDIRLSISIPVLGVCLTFFAMSTFTSVYQFYLAGVALGFCYSFTLFLAIPMVLGNWFQAKLGFAMGLTLSFSGIGGAIFNVVAGTVIQDHGWRSAYVVLASSIALIVLPFTLFVIRMHPEAKGLLPYGAVSTGQDAQKHTVQAVQLDTTVITSTSTYKYLLVFGGTMGLLSALQPNLANISRSLGNTTIVNSMVGSTIMASIIFAKIFIGIFNDKVGTRKTLMASYVPGAIALILILTACFTNLNPCLFLGAALYSIPVSVASIETPILVRMTFGSDAYSFVYPRVQRAYSLMSALSIPIYNFIYDNFGRYSPGLMMLLVAMTVSVVSCRAVLRRPCEQR